MFINNYRVFPCVGMCEMIVHHKTLLPLPAEAMLCNVTDYKGSSDWAHPL